MYTVTINETSRELSKRDRIRLKDTTDAASLDEVSQSEDLVIAPAGYAILGIHNDKADDPDYEQYLIWDEDGNTYVTGSTSFWRSFKNIWDEMRADGDEEAFEIRVIRRESKNYKGKQFLSCVIL